MKILVVTPIFSPEVRGPATYFWKLITELTKRNYRVEVITFTLKPTKLPRVPVTQVGVSGGPLIRQLRLLYTVISKGGKCDLLYIQGADVVGLTAVLAARILKKKSVVRFVGDLAWEEAFNKRLTSENLEKFLDHRALNWTDWLLRMSTRIVLNLSDRVIFPANHLRRTIVKYYHINENKTVVINNAV